MMTPKQMLAALGLAAAAPTAIAQTAFQWAAPFDGLWSLSSNWDPAGVPGAGSVGDTVALGLAGAYTVTADTSRTIAGLSINNPDAILAVRSGFTLTVNGPVMGAGTLVVHDQFSTSLSTVNLGEGVVVTSPVRLNAQTNVSSRARIDGQGAGATLDTEVIGNGRLLGVLHNDGLITTELPGDEIFVATSIPLTSTGEVRAVNAGRLNLSGGLDGGTLHADADSRVLSGSHGVVNATLTGELVVASADSLTLGLGNTHLGSIAVHDQSTTSQTNLNLASGATLGGSVLLNAPAGSDTRARITGLGAGATIDADVSGIGRLLGILHNAGTVSADQPGGQIIVVTSGPLTSTGEVRAVNGGRLNISAGLDGGTLHADADSRVLSGTAGIANATFTGELVVASSDSLTLGPGNTHHGSITVHDQSSTSITNLNLAEGASLGGTVLLNAPAGSDSRARITGLGAGATIDANVSGIGRLLGILHNTGTVSADQPGGQIIAQTSGPLTSTGEVRAVNGGIFHFSSGLDGGTLHADTDSRVLSGTAGVANATLTGTAVVAAGNTLYLQPGNTYNGSLVINDQTSTSITTVILSDGSSLGGEVVLNTTPDNIFRARIQGPSVAGQSAGIEPDAVIRGQGRLLGLINPFLGTLSPGFPDLRGEINLFTGEPIVLDPGSQSVFTLGDADSGSYDRVTVSGGLELGGTLVLNIEDGVTPQFGDRWDIVQGSQGITGFYDAYELPDAPPGLAYRVVIQPNGVFVRLTCAADFDGDLTLNFFDLSSFLTAYNNQDPRADFAAPFGELNFFDIAAFIALFNQGCQP